MNRYIDALNSFLSHQTPSFRYADASSILEMLYYYYTADNPVDNGVIRCALHSCEDIHRELPLEKADTVFDHVSRLCSLYEKQAFLDGVHVGSRLSEELRME